MMIDCDTCEVRGLACADCVVSVVLGAPPAALDGDPPRFDGATDGPVDRPIDLDTREQHAIALLAENGMVPPLRLVPRKAG